MTPDLARFTRLARESPKLRFTSLMGMLGRGEGLRASFERQPARKAPGVDGMRKADYEIGLDERLRDLSSRLQRMGYRPKPARRAYIPKSSGNGRRPLGIPCFEDRIVQDRLSCILQAIWEPEFRDCSFGFRPERSAHDALRRLTKVITHGRIGWVVEADIKGFFNEVCHDHMLRFLEHRIGDPNFVRVLRRFLKAGILEDGMFHDTEVGTPQGGLVSPVLANIYLHYVVDWWFEGRFAKSCQGEAHIVRYADDFVACFEKQDDARRFLDELSARLADFGLEVEPTKTRMLRFGRYAAQHCHREGHKRPQTFSFLGFTHYVGTSQHGKFVVGRRTDSSRARKKLREVSRRLQALRTKGGAAMLDFARMHLVGHRQYYGVSGNSGPLRAYFWNVSWRLYKWMNRRSQKKSISWAKHRELYKQGLLLPRPYIVHNLYPAPSRMR
jgi:group II intron reverse transcriptase/maturase